MKKEVAIKLLIIIITILSTFFLITPKTYAIGEFFTSGDEFIKKAETNNPISNNLQDMSGTIYNVLLAIGVVVALIVGMMIGIKFMTGSIEEKAKIKETLIPYIAGCVVIFGAFGIWKLVVTILRNLPSA